MKEYTENPWRYILFTNGAYDTNCYPLNTPDELWQLTTHEYYQRQLADYRSGVDEAKKRLAALIPQGRLKNETVRLHQIEHLVPSGWVFLDDDRPASEITAEQRHALVEERLAQLGMRDIPHVAQRSASMKYHLLVPLNPQCGFNDNVNVNDNRAQRCRQSSSSSSLRESWEWWRRAFDGILVLDPSTVNVNRLMFWTGELLTPPESLEALFGKTPSNLPQGDPLPASPSMGRRQSPSQTNKVNTLEALPIEGELSEGLRGSSIAASIVEQLCGTTAPPEGTRNHTLYEAARDMVYLDGITEEDIVEAFRSLDFLGLPEREAVGCIRSAMKRDRTWKYITPPTLSRALEEIENSRLKIESSSQDDTNAGSLQPDGNNSQLSKLRISESKGCLQALPSGATSTELILNSQFKSGEPELISLFTAHVPDNARMAVSSMVFAPLGAYLTNTVTIRDVSNKPRCLQFTSVVVGNSSSGKGFVDYVSDFITRRLRQRDAASWAALDAWQEQKRTAAKGDPQPLKPVVPLQLLSSNMTEPALLERLKALESTTARAYIKASEIDELRKFQTTGTRLGGGQDIILSAFDTAPYGALRVSAEAVSTMTVMSVNICASSTYPGTQEFFRQGVERGSVGRCDFSIVDDAFDVPLYKDFTPEAAARLDEWTARLENATGEITCPHIDRLIEEIRLSYHDPASTLSWQQNPEYFKLCHRQLLITKQKATILYICNDYQWDPTWEPWLTEAFYYGMQCKISIFASEIASWAKRQCTCVTHIAVHGPKSELADLPHTFTLADLVSYKRSKATTPVTDEQLTEKAKSQIRTWIHRGRIMPTDEPGTWRKAMEN